MVIDAVLARVPTVRARLILLALLQCALMALLAISGMRMLEKANESLRTVYDDRVVPLQQLKQVADMYAVNLVDTTHKLRMGSMDAATARRLVDESASVVAREWGAYLQTVLVDEERRLVAEIQPLMARVDRLRNQLRDTIATQDEAALDRVARDELYQAVDPLSDKLNALVAVQLEVAAKEYQQSQRRHAQASGLAWLGLAVACLIGCLFAAVISSRIMRSLGAEPGAVREVVQGIARGALNRPVAVASGDQMSVMAFMQTMQQGLAGMVREVRCNVDELHAASGQIAQGNLDLSSRTEETAATTQRATARLSEVMGRLQQRIVHAGEARELAQGTYVVAEKVGAQMARTVEAMQGINVATRRIADITGAIDGIAFQTNILALNAAVEAARAGEAGRGFAVVAAEVRVLAQRAADAAREIKSLIAETTGRTESGTAQVEATGLTLQQMVAEIEQLSSLMLRLDSSAGQDGHDIDELQLQLQEMDRVAQQNAALVEEMAASSEQLKDQAGRLALAVHVFKV
ncbi:methyl-accepting chemotaxis protein [Roseateles sp.]|jgi:methyl-accepting chemotaxis protein|uniref:methyl-accepting chemotaxis protein n=1 Tax=Roseateles sp. TaxID=1971397 RepID=UPI0037C63875